MVIAAICSSKVSALHCPVANVFSASYIYATDYWYGVNYPPNSVGPWTYIEDLQRVQGNSIVVTNLVMFALLDTPPLSWCVIPIEYGGGEPDRTFISGFVSLNANNSAVEWSQNPAEAAWWTFGQNYTYARLRVSKGSGQQPTAVVSSPSNALWARDSYLHWLPAVYKTPFQLTCYVMSMENESKFSTSSIVSGVTGLPENISYLSGFLKDVIMQGSGQTKDGTIIHYNGKKRGYSIQACPLTASGACAADGTTIAVDPTIVPMRSTLDFKLNTSMGASAMGSRIAQDTGGGIKGNHIDIYFGTRRQDCSAWGNKHQGNVALIHF